MIKDKNEVGALEVSISKEKAAKTKDINKKSKSISSKYRPISASARAGSLSRNNSNNESKDRVHLNKSPSQLQEK